MPLLCRVDNLPPEAPDDQPVPKTLSRLLKAGKHLSQSDKRRKKKESASDNVDPERGHLEGVKEGEVTSSKKKLVGKRSLKGEVDSVSVIDEENDRKPLFKRQKGESLKAYLERIDIESNARIMEAYRKSRGKSERRKRCVCFFVCLRVCMCVCERERENERERTLIG